MLGARVAAPLAQWIGGFVPNWMQGFIANVLSMALSTLLIVPIIGFVVE